MAGNANSGSHKDKLFRKAMVMELSIRDAGEDMKTLRAIASDVIDMALSQNPMIGQLKRDAINMVADRMDGKPAQALIGGDGEDNPISHVHRIELVAPSVDDNPED